MENYLKEKGEEELRDIDEEIQAQKLGKELMLSKNPEVIDKVYMMAREASEMPQMVKGK
jgi:hypothetical protein